MKDPILSLVSGILAWLTMTYDDLGREANDLRLQDISKLSSGQPCPGGR